MEIQSGFALVNGAHLYYEVAGSGHPLALVHGNTLDTRMWDDQFESFALQRKVIRYDVRGFGKSSTPTDQPCCSAEDLKGLLEFLGIAQAHILGLSMGGRISIDFALSYPAATTSLITVDSGLEGFQRDPKVVALRDAIVEKARKSGVPAAIELWLNDPLFQPANEQPAVAAKLRQIVTAYSGWHWVNHDPQLSAMPPAVERLEQLTMPTLAIIGEHDLPDFHTIARLLEQRAANARRVIIPGVGHMSNMEDPDGFNQIAQEFLSEV